MVSMRATTLRLTRRGRAVVVLAVLMALLVAGFSLGHSPSQAESHVVKPRTVTVQAGETLWGLAVRIAPHADPRLVVTEIQQLNHLKTPAVFGGQQLVVPSA
jgi:LysM repeat protein